MQASERNYQLLPTNLFFETWLLMHFVQVESSISKKSTFINLGQKLRINKYTDKEKSEIGIIAEIIGDGASVRQAIIHARELEELYRSRNLKIGNNIVEMNPYTAIHTLVEKILSEIT